MSGLLEIFKNKNLYVITDSDLDGIASHIITRYYLQPFSKKFEYHITSDREFKDLNLNYLEKFNPDCIIFCDIAPKPTLYEKLLSITKNIYIFDHHITSKFELGERDNYYFYTDKCGARIIFEELNKDKRVKRVVKQFIELVDVSDRWQDQSLLWKKARELHNVMYGTVNWQDKTLDENTKYIPFINKMIDKFHYTDNFFFNESESLLAKNGHKKEKDALDNAKRVMKIRVDDEGNSYIYFECVSKISYVANCLLKEYYDKIKYCIAYSTFDKKEKKVSLRSMGNFDCSLIAQKYGGGGQNKNAAAINFTNNQEFFEKLRIGDVHLL